MSKKEYVVTLNKDTDGWIFARCNELHANSQGKTESEAIENVKDAINLMIEELKKSKNFSLKIVRKYKMTKLSKITQDDGILSQAAIKNIEKGIADIKAGRVYTSEQVKKKLGLK